VKVSYLEQEEVMSVMSTELQKIREGIGLSLEGLARRSGISARTVRNAEDGKRISFESSIQILQGLNSALSDAGKQTISLDDLGLTL